MIAGNRKLLILLILFRFYKNKRPNRLVENDLITFSNASPKIDNLYELLWEIVINSKKKKKKDLVQI